MRFRALDLFAVRCDGSWLARYILTERLPKGRPYGIPALACLNTDDFSGHRKVLFGFGEETRGENDGTEALRLTRGTRLFSPHALDLPRNFKFTSNY